MQSTKEECMPNEQEQPVGAQQGKPEEFHIQIDRKPYTVTKSEMKGAELRLVPTPPVAPDRDLFEVVPGQDDRKLADTDVVEIRNGKRFFTAPSQINPGRTGRLER
jgi:hypothetical protein